MEVSIEGSSIGCSIDQSNWVAPVNLSYMVSYRDTGAHSDWLSGPFFICVYCLCSFSAITKRVLVVLSQLSYQ